MASSSSRYLKQFGPGAKVIVLSTHLDDGILSVGGTIARLVQQGAQVTVCTVFAGMPDAGIAPDAAQSRAGFASAAASAETRRREDLAACEVLGADALWLDFIDHDAIGVDPQELFEALHAVTADAALVLAPGMPLVNRDHQAVAAAAQELASHGRPVAWFQEQPYATWIALAKPRFLGGDPWRTTRSAIEWRTNHEYELLATAGMLRGGRLKFVAAGKYHSQLTVLRRCPRLRILAHELLTGGERIAWPRSLQRP